jgi:signal transduction histidine kinase
MLRSGIFGSSKLNTLRVRAQQLLTYIFLALSFSLGAQESFEARIDTLDAYFARGEYEELIYGGQELLEDWRGQDTLSPPYARLLLNIGRAYIQVESFPDALRYNNRALAVYKAINDSMGIARTYSNIAGVYYYSKDSLEAFRNLKLAGESYPDSADRQLHIFMEALLYMEFGTPQKGLKMVDSLLPHLEGNTRLYLNVSVSSIEEMDSMEFVIRYPQIIQKLEQANLAADFNVTAYLEVLKRALTFDRLDIVQQLYPDLEQHMLAMGHNASISHKAVFEYVKAWNFAYQKDYKQAFEAMQEYSDLMGERDSIQGLDEINKLKTQVRLKESELNAYELESALEDSRQQSIALVVLVVLFLILIVLIYRVNRNTRERNKAIEEVAATREKMLSILSHDMRTPLSQLDASLSLVDNESLNPEELAALIPEIRKGTETTLKLLDRTVAWINVNRSDFKMHWETVSVAELFGDLEDLLSSRAQAKKVRFEIHAQVEQVETERFLLHTALFNLLSNAFKFVNEGGSVFLRALEDEGSVIFEVSDSGQGISKSNLQKIKQEISFSSTGTLSEQGSGLGLTIVRDACLKLGARFDIKSELGEGTVCRIYFN